MVNEITDNLSNCLIVRIGNLVSLRLSLSNENFANEAEVTGNAIKNTNLLFTPDT